MGVTVDKLNYLRETKKSFKTLLVSQGADITDATPFREYVDAIEELIGGGNILGDILEKSIVEVDIPKEIVGIGDYVFYHCNFLKTVNFPIDSNIMHIGSYAFSDCILLTNVTLPNSLTSIGSYAFYSCQGLTEITIPENVTAMGNNVFYWCLNLRNVLFSTNMIDAIGAGMFRNCTSLTKVLLPSSVQSIYKQAFDNCTSLETLILPRTENITSISNADTFTNTPIASGTGYIYVPSALVSEYQSATNWYVFANQFRAIEDYPDIVGG